MSFVPVPGPFDLSAGTNTAIAKRIGSKTMAVSFERSAIIKTNTEPISQPTTEWPCLGAFRSLRDFLLDFVVDGAVLAEDSANLRYKRTLPRIAADISGSGTVTQATDSVWAGCIANRAPASNAAVRSRSNLQTSVPSNTATSKCFAMLSRCHPQGDI